MSSYNGFYDGAMADKNIPIAVSDRVQGLVDGSHGMERIKELKLLVQIVQNTISL